MTRNLERIDQILEAYEIEIVSFGLAPNPNGFCFEASEETPLDVVTELSGILDNLNKSEIERLKKENF